MEEIANKSHEEVRDEARVVRSKDVIANNFRGDLQLDITLNELTVAVDKSQLIDFCSFCKDRQDLAFKQLIDLSVVDYLNFAKSEWATQAATNQGFSRGVNALEPQQQINNLPNKRFAVVYHLLSIEHNVRLRIECYLAEEDLIIPSVYDIFASASWYEREAFDLFGVIFSGHPDLRRILTDYGFIGHPLRKDFPLSGHVEMRYDAAQQRVVYEPVDITDRVTVPKVIRSNFPQMHEMHEMHDK